MNQWDGNELIHGVMDNGQDELWEENLSAQVDSWWGAVAALMLLQAYSFVLLQGFVHLTAFVPVTLAFYLIFMVAQTAGLRVMHPSQATREGKA